MKTKQQATNEAKSCKRKMRFGEWEISVNENLGWYWCLEAADGIVTLWPSSKSGHYYCMIAPPGSKRVGSIDWSSDQTFKDPNNAVKHTVKLMWSHIARERQHSQIIDIALNS